MKSNRSISQYTLPQTTPAKPSRFKRLVTASAIALLVLTGTTSRATVDPFTTSGTWTCPVGVTTVSVECWGGGGAGGSAK